MEIRKIMSKAEAEKEYQSICEKLNIVNIDDICEDTEKNEYEILMHRKLLQGIMCGLVYFDEEKKYLVQKLIAPLESGELKRTELTYKYKLNMKRMRNINESLGTKSYEDMLSEVTCEPEKLIGEMQGTDFMIAQGCLGFFTK